METCYGVQSYLDGSPVGRDGHGHGKATALAYRPVDPLLDSHVRTVQSRVGRGGHLVRGEGKAIPLSVRNIKWRWLRLDVQMVVVLKCFSCTLLSPNWNPGSLVRPHFSSYPHDQEGCLVVIHEIVEIVVLRGFSLPRSRGTFWS